MSKKMDEMATEASASIDHESQVEEKNNQQQQQQQQQMGKENRIQEPDDTEKTCFACKRSLAKSPQLINLAGQAHKWHPECFRCHICRQPMDGLDSCHLYKEKILCRSDYLRLRRDNSIKCSRCRWQINASDWVRRAGQDYVYHLACFNCDICSRQLNTGDQFAIDVQQKGRLVRLLCRLHFSIDSSSSSSSSLSSLQAHLDTTGQQQLTAGPCKTVALSDDEPARGGLANHHERIGQPPSSDEQPYSSSYTSSANQQTLATHAGALIMNRRQQYLHLLGPPGAPGSVTCSSSSSSMNEIISSAKKCSDDSHTSDQRHAISSKSSSSSTSSSSSSSSSTSSSSSSSSSSTSSASSTAGIINTHNNSQHQHQQQQQQHSLGSLSSSKSKRVRTTFTEDQLSILQNHFHIDSNPDGQDLERIATITGLSKRVTQVWFQNSRARQKKYMIKRKPSSSGAGEPVMATTLGLANNNQQVLGRQFQHQHQHHHQQQQHHHQLFDRTPSMLCVGDSDTVSVVGAPTGATNSDQVSVKMTDQWPPNETSNQSDFSNSVEMDLVAESMDESDGRAEEEDDVNDHNDQDQRTQDDDHDHDDDNDDGHRSVDLSANSHGGPISELSASNK